MGVCDHGGPVPCTQVRWRKEQECCNQNRNRGWGHFSTEASVQTSISRHKGIQQNSSMFELTRTGIAGMGNRRDQVGVCASRCEQVKLILSGRAALGSATRHAPLAAGAQSAVLQSMHSPARARPRLCCILRHLALFLLMYIEHSAACIKLAILKLPSCIPVVPAALNALAIAAEMCYVDHTRAQSRACTGICKAS